MRAVLSNDAVTIREPSGLKPAEVISSSWPHRTAISLAVGFAISGNSRRSNSGPKAALAARLDRAKDAMADDDCRSAWRRAIGPPRRSGHVTLSGSAESRRCYARLMSRTIGRVENG